VRRLALAAAAVLVARHASAEDAPRFLGVQAAFAAQSGAVWRGERLTDVPTLVLSPALSVTFADLVTLWGEASWDTHTQTILRRHGNRLVPEVHRYTEKSVGISISKNTKLAELSLDASATQLADGAGTPKAATLGFVSHLPLSPGLEVTRDIGAPRNWYFAPKLAPKARLADDLSLQLLASIGYYAGATLQSRFFGGDLETGRYSGASDATASAKLVFEPGALTVSLKVLYTTFLSEEVRRRVGQIGQPKSTALLQLGLSYDF